MGWTNHTFANRVGRKLLILVNFSHLHRSRCRVRVLHIKRKSSAPRKGRERLTPPVENSSLRQKRAQLKRRLSMPISSQHSGMQMLLSSRINYHRECMMHHSGANQACVSNSSRWGRGPKNPAPRARVRGPRRGAWGPGPTRAPLVHGPPTADPRPEAREDPLGM